MNDVNVNSNFEEVHFSLNPVSDSSASYFCKNPKETSSFSKNEKLQKCASSDCNMQLHSKGLPKEMLLTDHDYTATCNNQKHCCPNSENLNEKKEENLYGECT